jgi:hypothetical protein
VRQGAWASEHLRRRHPDMRPPGWRQIALIFRGCDSQRGFVRVSPLCGADEANRVWNGAREQKRVSNVQEDLALSLATKIVKACYFCCEERLAVPDPH